MKYIKRYENSSSMDNGPKRGYYVICEEEVTDNFRLKKLKEFLANNIGKIVSDCHKGYYTVYYSNVRDNLDILNFFNNGAVGQREMLIGEIKYFAKTKEELDMIISANKYNL